MKKTPLYDRHVALNARIIDFGGWALPVQYSNLMDEHKATRTCATLFDISHMGEIEIRGPQAFDLLQSALTRDLSTQRDGQIKLSVLLTDSGGIIDDLTVYKKAPDVFWLVTNAAAREADYHRIADLLREGRFDCQMDNLSDTLGKLDVQGPVSQKILQKLTTADLSALRFYTFTETEVASVPALVSRSGYTGEDGFEIYAASGLVGRIWDALMEVGVPVGLKPAGLGARDTLRLEAGMLLNGQDITETVTPLEVPYGWLISRDKDFAGKAALEDLRKRGVDQQLAGFEMTGRGIARHGYPVLCKDRVIGRVTSGSFSPTLGKAIGLAMIERAFAAPDTNIAIAIRDALSPAKISPLPFYKREKK